MVAPEEAALIARAQEGDQDAFAVLVRTHQRQVYALALRMLRENEAAYEATQEVFLAAWQGLRGFKGKARFATWLYRITYHHCLRVAEAQKREHGAAGGAAGGVGAGDAPGAGGERAARQRG